jgi:hypothetical protein
VSDGLDRVFEMMAGKKRRPFELTVPEANMLADALDCYREHMCEIAPGDPLPGDDEEPSVEERALNAQSDSEARAECAGLERRLRRWALDVSGS